MTTRTTGPSREIDGKGRTLRELLAGRKCSIDYYQREYKWQKKQVAELLEDLADKFLASHEPGNERSDVAEYGHYFLSSIIISDKDGQKFIIDGQQRLTTLTLLLIFLQHQLEDVEQKGQVAEHDHNPGFLHFVEQSGLLFRPHAEFQKVDLDARQVLYQRLAEQIWNPDRLAQEAES